jgi:amino acid transporter
MFSFTAQPSDGLSPQEYVSLFLKAGGASAFLHQENNKFHFFFTNLLYFMYKRAVIPLD